MRLHATKLGSIANSRGFGDQLLDRAGQAPNLDLNFAGTKTLDPRVTFTRASTATYVGGDGTLRSAATNEARFDHNPTTGESLGLLVEEARTNSVTNNTMVGAVAGTPGTNPTGWIYATASSNGLTISIAGTGVENGINYIDYRFNGTTVASPNGCAIGIANATAATGQTWTASTYWKLAAGTATGITGWQIGIIENTAGGSFVTGAFYTQTAPTSAALITQRPTATRTLSGGATVGLATYPIQIAVVGNTAIDFTIRIGLPQLEQGAFATSPILTSTATATRAADLASITGTNFSSWYNQTEGSVFCAAVSAPVNNIAQFLWSISDGTTNEWILSRRSTGGVIATGINDNSIGQGGDIQSAVIAASASYKAVYAYALNNLGQSVNGAIPGTVASATLPTTTRFDIGQNFSGTQTLNGTIKRLTFWPIRLPNATLQAITTS